MIKLTKLGEPTILNENKANWTEVLMRKERNGETPTDAEKSRYRHPQIKQVLIEETHGKCAYCESYILHTSFGDVEHIHPKSKDMSNSFCWENLTLACDRCNTLKGSTEGLVDPYADDPERNFEFLGPAVMPYPTEEKAILTERCLRLNRLQLIERRQEKIKYLSDQLLILNSTTNPALRDILKRDLEDNETASNQEFAATARSFLKLMLPKVLGGI